MPLIIIVFHHQISRPLSPSLLPLATATFTPFASTSPSRTHISTHPRFTKCEWCTLQSLLPATVPPPPSAACTPKMAGLRPKKSLYNCPKPRSVRCRCIGQSGSRPPNGENSGFPGTVRWWFHSILGWFDCIAGLFQYAAKVPATQNGNKSGFGGLCSG